MTPDASILIGDARERKMERLRQARGFFMRYYEMIRRARGASATGGALSELEDLLEMRAAVAWAIEELGKAQT
jgi:hypothetical protein